MRDQEAGEQFIEEPDEWEAVPGERLYCFLSADRVCGGECVAYDPDGGEWPRTRCLLLNAVVSASGALSNVRKLIADIKKKFAPEKDIPGKDIPPPGV